MDALMQQVVVLDNARFTTLIIDPTIVDHRKIFCLYCGDMLFSMNRKFAVVSDGAMPYGGEIPLSVFRFTRICRRCKPAHHYICYLDT